MKAGDAHNFGKRVTLVFKNGIPQLQKPRTLFWEKLFLDPESYVRKSPAGIPAGDFFSCFGSLGYPETNLDSGLVSFVTESQFCGDIHWASFGQLMAMATAFGVIDLHAENILISESGLQVVDVECVFYKCESPADTFLLPQRYAPDSIALLSKLATNTTNFSASHACIAIEAMTDQFADLEANTEALIEKFRSFDFAQVPNRVLLRPTREYSDPNPDLPFIAEEVLQLRRGDIPYFFKYSGEDALYYYSSPSEKSNVGSLTGKLRERAERSNRNPRELLSRERIEKLKAQSISMAASRFMSLLKLEKLESKRTMVSLDGKEIKIRVDDIFIAAKLPATGSST